MSKQQFIPFSSQLGIAGTSYRLQMGMINEKWAARILKGKDVIDSHVWQEDEDIPNANSIVGYVLKTVQLPMINPYQVSKTVQFLRKEAIKNKEQPRAAAPVAEAKKAREQLEKVPESELKRMPDMGWVKEDEPQKPAEKPAPEKVKTAGKRRKLPPIPSAGGGGGGGASDDHKEMKEKLERAGIFCVECGTKILYCPVCGKKLVVD
ncbi:MAG: hypothetical protein ACTSU5_16925 [Promethearchaeota archaeon]